MTSSNCFSYSSLSTVQRACPSTLEHDRDATVAQTKAASPKASASHAPTAKETARLSHKASMQCAVLDLLNSRYFEGAAVTLTFASSRFLTEDIAERTVSELMKRLNKFARGRGTKRPLWSVAVREGGTKNSAIRLHYHMKIEVPTGMDPENFVRKIEHYWTKLRWASSRQNRFTSESDAGWISYILKIRTKPNYADAIDWNNTRLPDPERLPSALEEPAR